MKFTKPLIIFVIMAMFVAGVLNYSNLSAIDLRAKDVIRVKTPEDLLSTYPLAPAFMFDNGKKKLVYVATYHDKQSQEKVTEMFSKLEFDCVIVEGVQERNMANNGKLLIAQANKVAGTQQDSEMMTTIRLAQKEPARIIAGEASDQRIYERMISAGYTMDDILGFYVLRMPEQWFRRGRLSSLEDRNLRTLVDEFIKSLLSNCHDNFCTQASIDSFESFLKWYKKTNGCSFFSCFEFNYASPGSPSKVKSVEIARSVMYSRDVEIIEIIEDTINSCDATMAVYGIGHYLLQYPALEKHFGAPTEF